MRRPDVHDGQAGRDAAGQALPFLGPFTAVRRSFTAVRCSITAFPWTLAAFPWPLAAFPWPLAALRCLSTAFHRPSTDLYPLPLLATAVLLRGVGFRPHAGRSADALGDRGEHLAFLVHLLLCIPYASYLDFLLHSCCILWIFPCSSVVIDQLGNRVEHYCLGTHPCAQSLCIIMHTHCASLCIILLHLMHPYASASLR